MSSTSKRRNFIELFTKLSFFLAGLLKWNKSAATEILLKSTEAPAQTKVNDFYQNLIEEFENEQNKTSLKTSYFQEAANFDTQKFRNQIVEQLTKEQDNRYYLTLSCSPYPDCTDPKDDCWGPPGCEKK